MRTEMDESEAIDFIIGLVYERCRVRLHDGKQHLIRARLGKRLRQLKIDSLTEYCEWLRHSKDEDEITQVVDALTTNFTNFLREEDHFRFLVGQALPAVLAKGQRSFQVWSAACASGEEPYSLAFYLAEHYPIAGGWDWHILATDVSTKALDKARQGIYPADRLTSISPEWLRRYFQRGHDQWEGHCRIKPSLAERITFQHLNLLGRYEFPERFEVIFCRNVMIYFDRPTQEQLVRHLTQCLTPKGFLLVGHAESLTGLQVPVRCRKPSIYQKD
ncbi:MAG TPA: protein-glutamate O-methyltransferase CheR [Candidatus Paceibacterota bacterium]|nr:protein-glutamate O-methyltransferase CheR [Verrucomicrobiota bacterium]HRY50293.1 protein-glutamate O-methyltransferase CheR [Candidatus Paceibacterota bacterium]